MRPLVSPDDAFAGGAAGCPAAPPVMTSFVGAAPALLLVSDTFPTRRPTRPSVANPTPRGRETTERGADSAPTSRRQPLGRSRAASAGVRVKSRGRVVIGGGADAVARARARRSSWSVAHSA